MVVHTFYIGSFVKGTVVHSVLYITISVVGNNGPYFPVYFLICNGKGGPFCPVFISLRHQNCFFFFFFFYLLTLYSPRHLTYRGSGRAIPLHALQTTSELVDYTVLFITISVGGTIVHTVPCRGKIGL